MSAPEIGPTEPDDEHVELVVEGPRWESVPWGMWEVVDGTDLRVWLTIRSLCAHGVSAGSDVTGAWPGYDAIAARIHGRDGKPVSADTVKRAVSRLADSGHLSRVRRRRRDGSLGTYRYTLHWVEHHQGASVHSGADQARRPTASGTPDTPDIHYRASVPPRPQGTDAPAYLDPSLTQTPPPPSITPHAREETRREEEAGPDDDRALAQALRAELQDRAPDVQWQTVNGRDVPRLAALVRTHGQARLVEVALTGQLPVTARAWLTRWAELAPPRKAPGTSQPERCPNCRQPILSTGICPTCPESEPEPELDDAARAWLEQRRGAAA